MTPTAYNAIYEGGLLGAPDPAPTGSAANAIGDKLELNFAGLKIQPKRWNADHSALIWNTISSSSGNSVDPVTSGEPTTSTDDDLDRRFDGGNIYGGCYTSGIVNGNVVININSSIVDREILFDKVEEDETGEDKLYGNDQYNITERHSGVLLSEQGMDRSTCLVVVRACKPRYGVLPPSTSIAAICSRYSVVARKAPSVKEHIMREQER